MAKHQSITLTRVHLRNPPQLTRLVVGSQARAMVGIYDKEKRAAMEAWGALVMALVEGHQAGVVVPFARSPIRGVSGQI
jgi:hypothetical protein